MGFFLYIYIYILGGDISKKLFIVWLRSPPKIISKLECLDLNY